MTPLEAQHIFFTHCRTGPCFIGWQEPGRSFQQRWCEDEASASALIAAKRDRANVWCSMGAFPSPEKRDAASVELLKAYWLDIDAHGKPHTEVSQCMAALQAFCQRHRLPKPNIVHMTGHGLQAFWLLDVPVSRNVWQPVAEKLQLLAQLSELGADPITADGARILRVPGTINFRDPENPVATELHIGKPGTTALGTLESVIDRALSALPQAQVQPAKAAKAALQDTPANNLAIRDMLSILDPDADYTIWRDIVWAVAASGLPAAHDIAREWSSKGAKWLTGGEQRFEKIWANFAADRGTAIGLGTLVHKAREAGYTGAGLGSEPFAKLSFAQNDPLPASRPAGSLITQRASDIEPEPVEWLVEGAIPLGMMVVIGGQPGLGKSQIALKLAAAVTTGKGFPDV